jgi:hypothetical protein
MPLPQRYAGVREKIGSTQPGDCFDPRRAAPKGDAREIGLARNHASGLSTAVDDDVHALLKTIVDRLHDADFAAGLHLHAHTLRGLALHLALGDGAGGGACGRTCDRGDIPAATASDLPAEDGACDCADGRSDAEPILIVDLDDLDGQDSSVAIGYRGSDRRRFAVARPAAEGARIGAA